MMEDIKDSEADASDTGLDYASVSSDGGLPSISRGDHLDTTNLMMMKLEQSNHGQQPDLQPLVRQDTYPEGMNTTLPGPSDIQGVSDSDFSSNWHALFCFEHETFVQR